MKDWILDVKVFLAGSGYFIIGFSNADFIMKLISFSLFVGFTIRRWQLMERKNK